MTEILFLVFLVSIFLSYFFGRRIGFRQGYASGEATNTLRQRERSFYSGRCQICGSKLEEIDFTSSKQE
ncbi:MAG: hypothetical protein GX020_05685 [Firmicutes bacterium]|nr:hypothetical protein [Bacillota bacterium]